MALFKQPVQLVVASALLLFLAGCSGAGDSAAEPGAPDPAATVETQPDPADAPSPSPTATNEKTTARAVDEQPKVLAVDLWYRRVNNQVLHDDVSRELDLAVHQGAAEQVDAVIELWIAGTTDAESDAGVIDYYDWFKDCDERFESEVVDDRAIVTLCDRYGHDGQIGTSLEKTLIETGLVANVAVLAADGQKCIGEPTDIDADKEPLWCLDEQNRLIDAFRCPINRATSTAVITGVEEWANARLEPSLDGQIAAELRLGQLLTVYPSTLTYDGSDLWWVTVELGGKGRCGSVAANLLDGTFGNYGDVLPGVSFDLPTTGTWTFGERESVFDRTSWTLQGSFATGLSLQLLDGPIIDRLLEDQKRSFDRLGYEFDGDWFDELVVPGGDRAVRYQFLSESGDSGVDVLLVEFDGFALRAYTSVYITDVAPNDELDAFLNSISIDRQAFNDAFAGVDATQVELHGKSYFVVSEVARTTYREDRACGTPYEYYGTNEFGERRLAGRLTTPVPRELGNDYLLWPVQCEGGSPAIFAVARVEADGSIAWQGTVDPLVLGVRGEFGTHTVNDDGTITFSGTQFGGDETFTDTFTLDDLLDNLLTGD